VDPSRAEAEAIELLSLLIERHEHEPYAIPQPTPLQSCGSSLSSKADLIPQLGSESAVSMFLAGQRRLALKQVRKL